MNKTEKQDTYAEEIKHINVIEGTNIHVKFNKYKYSNTSMLPKQESFSEYI